MLSAKDEQLLRSKQPLFHVWYLEDTIGEGSSGTVYRITDNNGNNCALKVIPITIDNEVDALHLKKQDCVSKRKYLDEMTREILAEVRVCKKLNHHAGIVNYQEYDVIEESDSFVRLILIRMDLLLPLNKLLRTKESEFSAKEVAAMGIDLLTSLSECRKHNIIHRDIKPSNIFATTDGRYLLGDFGSARLLEKTMMASHKGTLAYMAPEIAAGQTFNSTVDIYSLGIMMYQLLNNCRLPFLNDSFKFSDLESAVEKRLSGALLPYPENADRELGKIICKMCAHSPKDRYAAPEECLDDLKNYLNHNRESRKTKKRIKLSIMYMLLFMFLFMFLLVSAVTIVLFPKTGHDLDIGILSGNVNSSGAIACDENWLYYSQDVPGERGIRVSKDGTQKEVICDYTMHDINITDDYLFFSSQYTMNGSDLESGFTTGLYRMDKDGGNLICLDDTSILNPVVYDKSVYYLKDEGDYKTLCRIPVEGGKTEILSVFDKYTDNFYPYKDKLYIWDHAENQLISLDIHNGTKAVIIDDFISRFCIEDGLLYVTTIELEDIGDNIGYRNKIYVHEIDALPPGGVQANDSNSTVIIFPYKVCEFNVSNGVIYTSTYQTASEDNKPDKDGIWCVKSDGSSLKQIYTGNPRNLQLIDQKLYFSEGKTFYMDLNGTGVNKLDDMTLFYAFD